MYIQLISIIYECSDENYNIYNNRTVGRITCKNLTGKNFSIFHWNFVNFSFISKCKFYPYLTSKFKIFFRFVLLRNLYFHIVFVMFPDNVCQLIGSSVEEEKWDKQYKLFFCTIITPPSHKQNSRRIFELAFLRKCSSFHGRCLKPLHVAMP